MKSAHPFSFLESLELWENTIQVWVFILTLFCLDPDLKIGQFVAGHLQGQVSNRFWLRQVIDPNDLFEHPPLFMSCTPLDPPPFLPPCMELIFLTASNALLRKTDMTEEPARMCTVKFLQPLKLASRLPTPSPHWLPIPHSLRCQSHFTPYSVVRTQPEQFPQEAAPRTVWALLAPAFLLCRYHKYNGNNYSCGISCLEITVKFSHRMIGN